MTVRKIGGWKDSLRRTIDAALAALLPGGTGLVPYLFRIDGYLYPHEAVFLYWLARDAPGEGAIVEIGSFRGRSTLCLAAGVRDRGDGVVLAIDPHVYGTQGELRDNLQHFGLLDRVSIETVRSVEAAQRFTGTARCVYVDGDHAADAVQGDVASWLPHLAPGGFLVLHDSTELSGSEGPRRVAHEQLREGPLFESVGRIGATTWGRKRGGIPYTPPRYGIESIDAVIRFAREIRGTRGNGGIRH
jgi:predicted O-methyltransferase YrrM